MNSRMVPLGEVADIYMGVPVRMGQTRHHGNGGNIMLSVRALTDTGIDAAEVVQADLLGRDVEKYRVRTGDVLVSARSTTLKTAVVSDEFDGLAVNSTLIGVRCSGDLDARLLVAYLKHPAGQDALASVSQSATNQMNITVAALSSLEVPLPPVDEQRRLVEILEAADQAYELATEAAAIRRRLARQIAFADLTNTKSVANKRN